jgi:hypothetical protein
VVCSQAPRWYTDGIHHRTGVVGLEPALDGVIIQQPIPSRRTRHNAGRRPAHPGDGGRHRQQMRAVRRFDPSLNRIARTPKLSTLKTPAAAVALVIGV